MYIFPVSILILDIPYSVHVGLNQQQLWHNVDYHKNLIYVTFS